MERNNFLKVDCPRCRFAHVIFSKSSYEVKCLQCRYLLTKSTGGKAKIRARVREVM